MKKLPHWIKKALGFYSPQVSQSDSSSPGTRIQTHLDM